MLSKFTVPVAILLIVVLDVFATTQVQSAEKWAAFAKFAYEKGLISKTVEAKDCFINVLDESF